MATLIRKPGDPSYLKVVLLREILIGDEAEQLNLTVEEGEVFCLKAEGESPISSANDVCHWICGHARGGYKVMGKDQSCVNQWIQWENEKLKHAIYSTLETDSLSGELSACLKKLDDHFSQPDRQYVCGDALSLADVIIWATLYVLAAPQASTSKLVEKQCPNVFQWFTSLNGQKSFTNAVRKASDDSGYSVLYEYILKEQKQETSTDISAIELESARSSWEKGHLTASKPLKRQHPILPVPGERNILITSALPYVNNVPHLGNIIGCVLSGDVFARYCRLRNYRTIYICGTDEYGTATETKALEEKTTPQEICQKYFEIQEAIYSWFEIQFDHFGRTSTPQQTEIAQDIFTRLNERGFIRKERVEQLLCEKCNMFLADRFVEGHCPLCNYEDARGDQCDKCGKLINATELKNPRCKMCSSKPIVKSSNHLFLDLPKMEEEVRTWSQQSCKEGIWTANAEQITSSWIRDGLKPRCITRDLKWGTPVPLEGYESKVFYVWFDAPIGYLSITACYTKEWEKWWKNPKDVQLYQFMAKDNVPFHTVVFPCSLIGAQDNYTLLNHISSTEYLNYEDGKFSKSRGVGVFGNDAKDTNIPADVFRFYLIYIRPETHDTAFSWADFVLKCNSELLNNLGNFINRVLVFTKNNFSSIVQEINLTEEDVVFVAKINRVLAGYLQCLEKIKLRDGLRHILSVSRLGNSYIQANKPWELVKGSQKEMCRAGSVLGLTANVVCLLSVMMQPYMPGVSKKLQEQLQAPEDCNVLPDTLIQILPPGHKIGMPAPLFSKIEESVAQMLKERFSGKQEHTKMEECLDPKASLEEQLQKQLTLVTELKAKSGTATKHLDEEVKKLQILQQKVNASSTKKEKN